MLRLLSLSLLLAASAHAQHAASPAPSTGDRALLVVGAVGGGAVGLVAGPGALLVAGAATYGTSRALGLDPTLAGALLDTAVGSGVAVGVYHVAVFAATEIGGVPHDLTVDVQSALLGLAVGSATMGLVHGARLAWLRAPDGAEIAPATLSAPTGEQALGLRLRVGL